jgi:uncharacterized Ntn-hydrolase superfamily protein
MIPVATFSIVAYDPQREEWGVAVQSKFLACAALVSWAQAPVGAVATQSYVNVTYGSRGLALMSDGMSAVDTIAKLTAEDEQREIRQIGMVDHNGRAAAFTGAKCHDWAGHIVGDGYACQGNILVPGTVEAMAQRFEQARTGDGELADWLVAALAAGQQAGGDRRGRQAAGVMVVRQGGGYGGDNDHYLDLRVDDDPRPIQKLQKLVEMHHLFFGAVDPANLLPISEVTPELQVILQKTGHYNGPLNGVFDETTRTALRALVGTENLEERWNGNSDMIDRMVVEFLRDKYDGEDA